MNLNQLSNLRLAQGILDSFQLVSGSSNIENAPSPSIHIPHKDTITTLLYIYKYWIFIVKKVQIKSFELTTPMF